MNFPVEIEDAADAMDGAEVGVVECVIAGDGGVAGTFDVPGAEGAGGMNFAAWNGIGERGVIGPCCVAADIVHDDVFQDEVLRILAAAWRCR